MKKTLASLVTAAVLSLPTLAQAFYFEPSYVLVEEYYVGKTTCPPQTESWAKENKETGECTYEDVLRRYWVPGPCPSLDGNFCKVRLEIKKY